MFNLRSLVRDTIDGSLLPDPGQLADEVYRRISEADRDEALHQSLRHFVRQVMSEERMQTHVNSPSTGVDSDVVTTPEARDVPRVSVKVKGIRDYWQTALRNSVCVGETKWKFLGDCTSVDLLFIVDQRREMARRNEAKADQYDLLRGLLNTHQVAKVRDLPVEVLSETLSRAA